MSDTDPRTLARGAYRTPAPLAARAAIYDFQRPRVDLVGEAVAALAGVPGGGIVVDVGCGPGRYLRELRQLRGVGIDVSAGMRPAVVGSGDALPLRSGVADAALAMHMLYHLPEPQAGLRELRRVIKPGGRVVVSTNGTDYGLWQLFREAGLDRPAVSDRWPLETAAESMREAGFEDVRERVFDYELDVPYARPVLDYLDSCRDRFGHLDDGTWRAIRARIVEHGPVRTAGRVGILTAGVSGRSTPWARSGSSRPDRSPGPG